MQREIGRAALQKLDEWGERRRENASYLNGRLAYIPGVRVTIPPSHIRHAYYKYCLFIRPERWNPGWSRDRMVAAINAEGIWCNGGHCGEIFREKPFELVDRPERPLPTAEELFATAIMCKVDPTLEAADMQDTADALEKVLSEALS